MDINHEYQQESDYTCTSTNNERIECKHKNKLNKWYATKVFQNYF